MTAFESITVGQEAELQHVITWQNIEAFAALSGDRNPLHLDREYARRTSFQKPVAHGMLVASFVSTLIGMKLPGPGALWIQQDFRWNSPVFEGDEITVRAIVEHKSEATRVLTLQITATKASGVVVLEGKGTVMLTDEIDKKVGPTELTGVAIVTGASRGIGAAIVRAVAAMGMPVVVNYARSAQAAEEVCRGIRDGGGRAIPIAADVRARAEVDAMIQQAKKEFGQPVGAVVNNASGPIRARPLAHVQWEDLQEHFEVQVRGAFNVTQAVMPGMIERGGGAIVNIGSSAASGIPPVHWAAYVTAKAALRALTRSLAVELGAAGIRVNMVSPGMTATELISDIPERLRKVQAMQTPLRRLATPHDIAEAVAFLCSSRSAFISGADIPVSGGVST